MDEGEMKKATIPTSIFFFHHFILFFFIEKDKALRITSAPLTQSISRTKREVS